MSTISISRSVPPSVARAPHYHLPRLSNHRGLSSSEEPVRSPSPEHPPVAQPSKVLIESTPAAPFHAAAITFARSVLVPSNAVAEWPSSRARRKRKAALLGSVTISRSGALGSGLGHYAYIVGGRDRDTILERMPAHVQDLFVEINLIRIRLLPHPAALSCRARRWAASS